MTSKNSLCKKSLIADGFKRNTWLIALYSVILFFSLPITALLTAQRVTRDYNLVTSENLSRVKSIVMAVFSNMGIRFLAIPAAIVAVAVVFFYINSKKQVDFYHSLPVSRTKLFFTNIFVAASAFVIPYIISTAVAALAFSLCGCGAYLNAGLIFSNIGITLLLFAVTFCISLIAFMLCGNTVVAIMGTCVLIGYFPSVIGIISEYMQVFFRTYYMEMFSAASAMLNSSPVFYIMASNKTDRYSPARIIGYLVFCAVLVVLSLMLYQKRGSETAGKAISFKIAKPIIKYPLVFLATCVLGLLFRGMGYNSLGWTIFGFLCGALLAHVIIEIIYEFDFKACRKNLIPMAIFLAAFAVFYLSFSLDFIGFDNYLPDINSVVSVNVRPYFGYDSGYYYNDAEMLERTRLTDRNEILPVLSIARESIAELKNYDPDDYPQSRSRSSIGVGYNFKNGRTVYRYYTLSSKTFDPYMKEIYASDRFKNGYFDLIYINNHKAELNYTPGTVICASLNSGDEEVFGKIAQFSALSDAVCRDIMKTDADYLSENLPIFNLTFNFSNTDERSRFASMPVYENFTETLALLKEYGISVSDAFKYIAPVGVDSFEIYIDNYQMTVTDPAQINEICKTLIPQSVISNTLFSKTEYKYNISAVFNEKEDGYTHYSNYRFKDDIAPNFVAKYFIDNAGKAQSKKAAYAEYADTYSTEY